MNHHYSEKWGVEIIEQNNRVFINNIKNKFSNLDIKNRVNNISKGLYSWNIETKEVIKHG
jgi:type II secretory pathway component HofQ|tara:strand:- start:1751 stop:1930 length:180 start_codon:yes stop_codon:yes gene_type:complete